MSDFWRELIIERNFSPREAIEYKEEAEKLGYNSLNYILEKSRREKYGV